eukprot:jgi/Hompol1/6182/HPOL_002221-RA
MYPPGSIYSRRDGNDSDREYRDGESKEQDHQETRYDDVMYTKKLDMSSSLRHPVWTDGYHWYRHRQSPNQSVFIHILALVQDRKSWKPQSQGWTLLPIFRNGVIDMGNLQLPLYEKEPSASLLRALDQGVDADQALQDELSSESIRLTRKYASVIVRLCDARRSDELDADLEMVDKSRLGEYPDRFDQRGSAPLASSLVPKKMAADEFLHTLYTTLIEDRHLPDST